MQADLAQVLEQSLFAENIARQPGLLQALDPRAKIISILALLIAAGILFGHARIGPGELLLVLGSVSIPGVGGTLLGWRGLHEIRDSKGSKRGLPLAWVHCANRRPGEPQVDQQGRVTFEGF